MAPRRLTALLAAAFVAASVVSVPVQHIGEPAASALEPQTGLPVVPRVDTPRFVGGTVEDQVQVGDRIIVVGTFEHVVDTDGTQIDQRYLAAYDIDTGELDRSYDPQFNKEVTQIEPDGLGGVVVGGKFNTVDGAAQQKLARLDEHGERVADFRAETDAKVTALEVGNGRVYLGGPFSAVKTRAGWTERLRLAAVTVDRGDLDLAFDFPIEGAAGRGGELSVKGVGLAGGDLVVSHSGLTVAGERRVGAAIIAATPVEAPVLREWRTDFYDDNSIAVGLPLANTESAVSPDGTYFVVVHSGGDRPLAGRDAAVRFPVAGGAGVEPDWISRHFDSMFAVGISDDAVFVGGHFQFQEAPGASTPFPGDPNVNYGAGAAGQGAAQLGNEVVARQQIGALDPETGWSLNWNPGADAAVGVESLVVIERGLLVGQDGDTLGDKNIGRHGFFDIARDVVPDPELDTFVTSHFSGERVDRGPVTISGSATDVVGLRRVQLAIRHLPTGQYLQADGSLGGWVGLDTELATPGAQDSDWSLTVQMDTLGEYAVQAKAFSNDGSKDRSPQVIELVAIIADDALPDLDWNPAVRIGRTVTISGRAEDDRGVARITFTVQDLNTERWLQDDGTMGDRAHRFDADLGGQNLPVTFWEAEFTVPNDGRYRVAAEIFDTAGQDDQKFEKQDLTIATDDVRPEVTIAQEGVIEIATGGRVTLDGTIADAGGLEYARVRIADLLTLDGTRPDNTWGSPYAWVELKDVDGQDDTDYSWTSPELPIGTYIVQVTARDLLRQTTTVTRVLEVGPVGDIRPNARIDVRSVFEAPRNLTITGRVRDAVGVTSAAVYVQDLATKQWLQPDGQLGQGPAALEATLAQPGSTDTTASWTGLLPSEGRYVAHLMVWDTVGQRSQYTSVARANIWYLPNDELPVVGRNTPVDDAVLDAGPIFVTGRATDDNAVLNVRYRIRRSDGTWLRADGTFGGAQWLPASLTNPDRPGTNWDVVSPTAPPGIYTVTLRAYDDSGRYTEDTFTVTLE